MTGERLMTAPEVADLLAVPESWVREAARSGAIPHHKIGRYVRFRESDVLAWLDTCHQPGRSVTFRSHRPGAR